MLRMKSTIHTLVIWLNAKPKLSLLYLTSIAVPAWSALRIAGLRTAQVCSVLEIVIL